MILNLLTDISSSEDQQTTFLIGGSIPSFSGNQDKSGIGYEQWRSQLQTLLADQSYSDFQIMNAWGLVRDLKAGYWQVEFPDDDKEKTAFSAGPFGFFQWETMPMGLMNSGHGSHGRHASQGMSALPR